MLRHAKVAVKFEKGVQVDGTKTGFSLLFYFSLWYSVVVGLLCRVRGVVLIRFVLGHPVACAQRVLCAPHTHESLVRKSRGRERATAAGAHLSPSFVLSRFFFSTRPSSKEEEGFNLVRVWQRRTTCPGKCQHRYISETCERVSTHTEGGFLGGGYFLSLSPVSLSA